MLALAVIGSIVGLALGAAVHAMGQGRARHAVDGFVLGAIPLLIVVRLIPHVYESLGRSALVFVGAGFAALVLADRGGHERGETVSRAVLVPTLLLHALADGAALALAAAHGLDAHGGHSHNAGDVDGVAREPAHSEHGGLHEGDADAHTHGPSVPGGGRWVLVAAIVAHRVPEGLLVCAALVPLLGWRRTLGRLGGIGFATVVGAVAGKTLLRIVPDRWLDAGVAFGIGAMLRLAVHTHDRSAPSERERFAAGLAFVLGVTSVLLIPDPDSVLARAQPTEISVAQSLLPLFVETAPAMALAMLAMLVARLWGVHRSWLTSALFSSGQREGGAWLGRALRDHRGERLALWGAFAAAALGLDALVLSLGWFGPRGAMVRWSVAAILPLVWLGTRPPAVAHDVRPDAEDPVRALAANAGWYAVGLLSSAVLEAALAPRALETIGGVKGVSLAVVGGVCVPVPMTAAVALAAVMVHKGAGVDAVLAWLWCAALRGALSRRAWTVWIASAPVSVIPRIACALGAIVGLALASGRIVRSFPDLHPQIEHEHVPFEWVCVAIAAAVLLGILLRIGPRAVLESMAERPRESAPHRDGIACAPGDPVAHHHG